MARDPTGPPPIARLSQPQIDDLLRLEVPAHLASIDPSGFPRVTPIWFLWKDGAFYMTSFRNKPHVRNLRRDPKASVCVDVERLAPDGQRPNQQVKGAGEADLYPDEGGRVTREITLKYVRGPLAATEAERRGRMDRLVIRIEPRRLVGLVGGPPTDLEAR
jgi:nitroimidazol reductase NimA-like FMN-containing flavoprotein (pyridoxamine 5'-phosphate oxidase superfamily)